MAKKTKSNAQKVRDYLKKHGKSLPSEVRKALPRVSRHTVHNEVYKFNKSLKTKVSSRKIKVVDTRTTAVDVSFQPTEILAVNDLVVASGGIARVREMLGLLERLQDAA